MKAKALFRYQHAFIIEVDEYCCEFEKCISLAVKAPGLEIYNYR
jgi:hypothetical protein